MLKLREIVIDKDNMIVGGNMRYKALQQLGYTEIPDEWIKKADDYTPEELREFIVKDNNEFGENDWDMLGNEYTLEELDSWGTDLPNLLDDENQDKEKKLKKCPECGCEF